MNIVKINSLHKVINHSGLSDDLYAIDDQYPLNTLNDRVQRRNLTRMSLTRINKKYGKLNKEDLNIYEFDTFNIFARPR